MRLLLIRHAQTPANVSGIISTVRPGPGLTPLGHEQAAALPAALTGDSISAIYVSPLVRTSLTAAPLAETLGLASIEVEGLEEIEAGDLEDLGDHRSVMTYFQTVIAWVEGEPERAMPGGPDGTAFFDRFDRAVAQIAEEVHPDATVAVVSHGASIRAWVAARATNLGDDFAEMTILDNTSVVILVGSPADGWIVESWAGTPLGGADLADPTAPDPTGHPEN